MGFNLIYYTPMSGSYLMYGSILEKCEFFLKNGRFSGRIWPDGGNTTRADMAGLGSIGITPSGMEMIAFILIMLINHPVYFYIHVTVIITTYNLHVLHDVGNKRIFKKKSVI